MLGRSWALLVFLYVILSESDFPWLSLSLPIYEGNNNNDDICHGAVVETVNVTRSQGDCLHA